MRGRKPRPTKLKIARGTRKDRINQREPVIAGGALQVPVYLDERGRELWAELVALLEPAGVITPADRHGLGTLCKCFELWRNNPANVPARKDWIRLLTEFGLTPASRSRVQVGAAPEDDLDAFLGVK